MPVIAMTQEMATLGSDVAHGLCEALGLQQVRHEIGDVVAGKMHVKKSLIRKLREGKAGRFERWSADEKTMSIFTAEEIYNLAVKGNVLVRGWGATMLLRSVLRIGCVRVCAPMVIPPRTISRAWSMERKSACASSGGATPSRAGSASNMARAAAASSDL